MASGILILTQSGILVNEIMHSNNLNKKHVKKVYEITVEEIFSGKEKAFFEKGDLILKDCATPCKPAVFNILPSGSSNLSSTVATYGVNDNNLIKNHDDVNNNLNNNANEDNVKNSRKGVIELYEGRYHQIRRMFGALGNKVNSIHRIEIGYLSLSSLPTGTNELSLE